MVENRKIYASMKVLAYNIRQAQTSEEHTRHVRRAWKFINHVCTRKANLVLTMRFVEYVMKHQ